MKIVKFTRAKVSIKTNDEEFSKIRLNDLLSLSDGEVELVATVESITDNESEIVLEEIELENMECPFLKRVECSILGSVIDGDFRQQIDQYPITDVQIKNIDSITFMKMLENSYKDTSFRFGEYAGHDILAYLDGNKFYQRHSCIVGNTGCGKSETVTKIMEETAKLPGANIVIFDIHGEYSQLSYVDSIKMGEVPFPIWMLGLADMAANVLKVKEDSTVAMSALRKSYYFSCKTETNENKPIYFDFDVFLQYMKAYNEEVIGTGEVYKSGDEAQISTNSKV